MKRNVMPSSYNMRPTPRLQRLDDVKAARDLDLAWGDEAAAAQRWTAGRNLKGKRIHSSDQGRSAVRNNGTAL